MTAISLVIDASNVAYFSREKHFSFARVVAVHDAWQARDPDGQAHAVIDASIRERLVDPGLAAAAEAEHWLTVAAGDADDEILRLADEYGARIVSRDNFAWAVDRYIWLHRDRDRLYEAYFTDGQAQLRRRRQVELSPEKIAEAKRRKAEKAGEVSHLDGLEWRCSTTSPDDCRMAGQVLSATQLQRRGKAYYCWGCQRPAVEVVTAEPVVQQGPPTVTLLHRRLTKWARALPPEGIVVGRRSARHPDVVDVTDGLERGEARAISGAHLWLKPDHTGLPVAVHLRETNVSFLNPAIGPDGLPADNRMTPDVEYPLWPGDEVLLGPGVVRLIIDGSAG